ncbi:UNVERIFIED_CONTAM: hypothetical protein Sangu_1173800 [Sesamum angustifolium]|uniref:Aminotransferase-like plant mobile domain-containing protein n=1 Tax=Sesamum angustifolium TaxID=2727405 RepID=A0AAW2P0N0_9LAMI
MHFGSSIIEGDAKWDGDLCFTGEFRYTKGYWEWTQDVLSRCGDRLRHLKIYDAVYASLFTYDHNSDIVKAFSEAWCPLTNTLLTSAREMSISLWDLHELVGLPMMGCLYDEVVPSALELTGVDEKRDIFSSFHNPREWSTTEEALFAKLCIERSLKEEVYLAYLACWLCVFVLPGKDVNSICPSTFKMASLMANDRRVNLAIPVLASIYEGLNSVATFSKPAGTRHSFSIHFVYAWLACYFKTHYSVWQELSGPKMTRFSREGGAKYYEPREARKRNHKAEFVSWVCNMLVKDGPFKFVDDGRAEELNHSYFVAIRSSYLTLRQGGRFIIEPYSPHRFGRQFGPKSIKITLKRKKNKDKQVDGGVNDPPHALIPPIVIDFQAAVLEASKGRCSSHNVADSDSSNKDCYWKRQRKEVTPSKATKTNENASRSSLANFVAKLEDEVQSIDVGEESETSHLSTMTPLLGMGLRRKQSSPLAAVSVLKVHAFDEARSLSSEKLSQSLHDQQLKEVKARLQVVQVKASEEASQIQSAMDELEHVEEDIAVLKG